MSTSKINQLQLLQQNLQNILLQKQQLQHQQIELDSALEALQKTEKSYKIVGHLMVAAPKETLAKELEEKKEMAGLRLKTFITQEEKLTKSMEELQKEVLKEMKKDG